MYKLLILNKGSSVFAIQQSSISLFQFTVNEQEVLNNIHLSVNCFLTYKLFFGRRVSYTKYHYRSV